MNDNNLNQNDGTRYKATQNLNTVIESPQIKLGNVTDVNVQDMGYNNQIEQTNNTVNNGFLNTSYTQNNQVSGVQNNNVVNGYSPNINSNVNSNINVNSNVNPNASSSNSVNPSVSNANNVANNNYSYQPTLEGKKEKNDNAVSSVFHSGEFKVMIFILFILCLFVLVMPYVYDFIKNNFLN